MELLATFKSLKEYPSSLKYQPWDWRMPKKEDRYAADLKKIDNFSIAENVPDAGVNEATCETHLFLLEQFVSTKQRVDSWARHKDTHPTLAWRFYINNAIPRLAKWLQYATWGSIGPAIPPLDVLMIWHAFLQDSEQWLAFTHATGIEFDTWDWTRLVRGPRQKFVNYI